MKKKTKNLIEQVVLVYEPKTDLVYMKYKRPSNPKRFIKVQPKQKFNDFFAETFRSKKPYPFEVYKKRPKNSFAFLLPAFETFKEMIDIKLYCHFGMRNYTIEERKSIRTKNAGYILYFWDDAEYAEFVFHYSDYIKTR